MEVSELVVIVAMMVLRETPVPPGQMRHPVMQQTHTLLRDPYPPSLDNTISVQSRRPAPSTSQGRARRPGRAVA